MAAGEFICTLELVCAHAATWNYPQLPREAYVSLRGFRQLKLCIMFDSIRLQGMNASERTKVIACLANLLVQAAGVVTKERDDDER